MSKRTPFYAAHREANAKLVDFAGWDMPLHYGSQLKEHETVRQHAGMFDVSHMGIIDVEGRGAYGYLRYLLANDVERLTDAKALYTCMLNDKGGVIDDLIVYKMNDELYRVVVNAGTFDKDLVWMRENIHSYTVTLTSRADLAMLALQGPETTAKLAQLFTPHEAEKIQQLKPFHFLVVRNWLVARTGYTGEDGFEIILPADQADHLWETSLKAGFAPCGLGARDTLRLEAGLNLYGHDMDEEVTPFEANLGWTVGMNSERDFIGKSALSKQLAEGVKRNLVGLILEGPGIIRNHQKVFVGEDTVGEVTSGGYSPTLQKSIALARVSSVHENYFVEIRNKKIPARAVKPPFVRHGKSCFKEEKA